MSLASDTEFEYMFLSRLKADLDYFFGYGGRNERHLYYNNILDHIKEFTTKWNALKIKPDWLSQESLVKYQSLVDNHIANQKRG